MAPSRGSLNENKRFTGISGVGKRDCPNDINEAISSLIFASARRGDLLEIGAIPKLFEEWYGLRFVMSAMKLYPNAYASLTGGRQQCRQRGLKITALTTLRPSTSFPPVTPESFEPCPSKTARLRRSSSEVYSSLTRHIRQHIKQPTTTNNDTMVFIKLFNV